MNISIHIKWRTSRWNGNLIQEQQLTDLSKEDFIINLWTNSIFTIISTNLGLKIFDTLSLRCINKKTLPKYLTRNKLVEADSSNSNLNHHNLKTTGRIFPPGSASSWVLLSGLQYSSSWAQEETKCICNAVIFCWTLYSEIIQISYRSKA